MKSQNPETLTEWLTTVWQALAPTAPDQAWLISMIVIFLGMVIFKKSLIRQRAMKVVKLANETAKTMYLPEAKFSALDIRSISDLDISFYDEMTAEMAGLGFEHGADIENLDATAATPEFRTASRLFFSPAGDVVTNCFHLRVRGWARLKTLLVGGVRDDLSILFQSLLSDGSVVSTMRSDIRLIFSRPADFYTDVVPCTTRPAEVFETHMRKLKRVMAERGVESLRPIRDQAEYESFFRYTTAKAAAHREQSGPLSIEEFTNLLDGAKTSNPTIREAVLEEAQKFKSADAEQREQATAV